MVQDLHFPLIDDRRQAIPEAHRKTFEWIFEEPHEDARRWSNFAKWLETGSGVYWINGKAGSGKSTLMRYILDGSKARQHLKSWAGEASLEIAGFIFWNSGSAI
jgi:polynucleotide 5'-kinase involved in rRNA processing